MSNSSALTTEDWQTVLEIHGRIAQKILASAREPLIEAANRVGLAPGKLFHFVYVVENFDPSTLNIEAILKRDPFDHPSVVEGHLQDWAQVRWLDSDGNGRFHITEEGRQIRQMRWQFINDALRENTHNSSKALHECLKFLNQIITGIGSQVSDDYSNFLIRIHKGLKPPMQICPLLQLIEFRMDFGALRDDTHLAAWDDVAPLLSPVERELVSIVDSSATDLTTILEQQARRGFESVVYETAVSNLIQNKWIETDQNLIRLTQLGQQKRTQVETITNEKFFSSWRQALTNQEIEKFKENLEHLRKELSEQ